VFYNKNKTCSLSLCDKNGGGSDCFIQFDMRSICQSIYRPPNARILMTSKSSKSFFQIFGSNKMGEIGSTVLRGTGADWNRYAVIPDYCRYSFLGIKSSAKDFMINGFRLDCGAPTYAPVVVPSNKPVTKPVYTPVRKPVYTPIKKPSRDEGSNADHHSVNSSSSKGSSSTDFSYGSMSSDVTIIIAVIASFVTVLVFCSLAYCYVLRQRSSIQKSGEKTIDQMYDSQSTAVFDGINPYTTTTPVSV